MVSFHLTFKLNSRFGEFTEKQDTTVSEMYERSVKKIPFYENFRNPNQIEPKSSFGCTRSLNTAASASRTIILLTLINI